MIQKIASTVTEHLISNGTINRDISSIYQYGLELLTSSLLGALLIIAFGAILFNSVYALIFLFCFIALRSFCGGFHASSYFRCTLSSLLTFLIVAMLSRYTPVNIFTLLIILISCIILLSITAPVENEYKPIDNANRRKFKIITLLICFLLSFISAIIYFYNIYYASVIVYSISSVSVLAIFGKSVQNKKLKNNH